MWKPVFNLAGTAYVYDVARDTFVRPGMDLQDVPLPEPNIPPPPMPVVLRQEQLAQFNLTPSFQSIYQPAMMAPELMCAAAAFDQPTLSISIPSQEVLPIIPPQPIMPLYYQTPLPQPRLFVPSLANTPNGEQFINGFQFNGSPSCESQNSQINFVATESSGIEADAPPPPPPGFQQPQQQHPWQKIYCKLCSSNGEDSSVYSTHRLRDRWGKVTCPILRRYKCTICGSSGDGAHTLKYCPFNDDVQMDIRNRNFEQSRQDSINALSPELAVKYHAKMRGENVTIKSNENKNVTRTNVTD